MLFYIDLTQRIVECHPAMTTLWPQEYSKSREAILRVRSGHLDRNSQNKLSNFIKYIGLWEQSFSSHLVGTTKKNCYWEVLHVSLNFLDETEAST